MNPAEELETGIWNIYTHPYDLPDRWEPEHGWRAIHEFNKGRSGGGHFSRTPGDFLVLMCVWVAAPYVQSLAGLAANGTYQVFTAKIKSLLGDRQEAATWDLLVLRTPEGKLTVEIPGNLPQEAHAALVRDFAALVAAESDAEAIHIIWDQEARSWVKVKP